MNRCQAIKIMPVLLLVALPAVVQAQFTYATDMARSMITITGYSGSGGAVTIPGTIKDLPVVAIANSVFFNKTTITSITIPDGITSIGDSAFFGCSGLTSIAFPDSVTNIGAGVCFNCTSLTNATIGNGVTSFGNGMFSYCSSLTSFTMGGSGTVIPDSKFTFCGNLTSVTFPDSITSIGNWVFTYCNPAPIVIPAGVTNIGDYALGGWYHMTLPIYFAGNAVTNLGLGIFQGDNATTVY